MGQVCCVATVDQSNVAVVEKWGRFYKLAPAGWNWVLCCLGESVKGQVSLRVQQIEVEIDTKTKDNVFVQLNVVVQYQVLPDAVYDAFYRLANPHAQIRAYVNDVVRASVPKIDLDQVFEQKEDIAIAVKEELSKVMGEFGFDIIQSLLTDIRPAAKVMAAMNDINAAQRQRIAATDRAEAEKILVVKAAEADAESKYLSGVGIARQRKAIVEGLQESVTTFADSVEGTSAKDVMDLVLVTQYFDTLKDLGSNSKSSTIFIPHSPGSVGSVAEQVRDGFMQGKYAKPQKL